jgi:hypothetical protein
MFNRHQAIMLASALTLAIPIAVGVASFATPRPAIAQEQLTNTLTVSGQGTESVQTTITQVRLGVEAEGDTAEAVQAEVARRSNAVLELLRSRNVSQLQTTGISLSPRYDYSGDTRRLVGYQGSNMVSFEVPTEAAGDLLDEAVQAGASRIDGVSFIASDEAIAAARDVALQEATQDALAQADAVLRSLGLTRQGIVNIQIGGAAPPRPVNLRTTEALSADAAPTPVVGGEQDVQASVTLQIRY